MQIIKDLIVNHYSRRRQGTKIKYIVVHYTGCKTARGKASCINKYYHTTTRAVSAHYIVGDDDIYQCVETKYKAFHVGNGNDIITNNNSIGVDIVEHKQNEKRGFTEDNDWYFTESALNNAASLIACLMYKYDIPVDSVVRHYDVTGKWCPRPFAGYGVNTVHGETNKAWTDFKMRCQSKYNELLNNQILNNMQNIVGTTAGGRPTNPDSSRPA